MDRRRTVLVWWLVLLGLAFVLMNSGHYLWSLGAFFVSLMVWEREGQLVVNNQGQPVECENCPCDNDCGMCTFEGTVIVVSGLQTTCLSPTDCSEGPVWWFTGDVWEYTGDLEYQGIVSGRATWSGYLTSDWYISTGEGCLDDLELQDTWQELRTVSYDCNTGEWSIDGTAVSAPYWITHGCVGFSGNDVCNEPGVWDLNQLIFLVVGV